MKRAYADIPEGQIHYQTEGSGEPLLLLHQSTPLSSDEYAKMIPILAKTYRVIAMDTLGFGKSDAPPPLYEMPGYARSVAHFLNTLGISKTSIVGHHTGASIAVEVAAAYPKLVDKLILSGCPHYTPEMREERFKNNPIARTRSENAHHAAWRYEPEKRLPLIKSPILLLSGTKDIFYDRLEATKSLIPQCRTKIIEGGDSGIAREMPEEFAQAILEFLKGARGLK